MFNSSIPMRSQSKINSSKQLRHQFSPNLQESSNKNSIQQYLQTQNDTKIQSFKQSLNMLPDIETIKFQDNSRYYGQIVGDSIRHGIGIFQTEYGDIYMGDWQNDTYHGYGMYIYHEGERYEGDLVDGSKEGEGKYFCIDGKFYEGMWVADQREGHGVQRDPGQGIYYQGEWLDDQKHGKGKVCLLNSSDWGLPASEIAIMQGTWIKDKFSSGVIQTQVYQGGFQNQTMTGQGSYKFTDGSMYQGNFINNLMQGQGTYYYSNGDVYEGQFYYGLKHGKGVYRYFTGDVYTGGYEKDTKSGEGRFAFVNGNYYVGDFQRDSFHGKGKYFFTKDQAISGWWENGKLVKDQRGDQIGNNRKIALMRHNVQRGDRTPINDRSRSPISRSPMNRSPTINSFSKPNLQNGRSVSPFNMQRNIPRQQKAGMIAINPSRSPISKSKFMQVHTPGDSYFKSTPRQLPSTNKKLDSSIRYNMQAKSNIKMNDQEIQEERQSDRKLFDMLNEGQIQLEKMERRQERQRNSNPMSGHKLAAVQSSSQQVKKISKKFQR